MAITSSHPRRWLRALALTQGRSRSSLGGCEPSLRPRVTHFFTVWAGEEGKREGSAPSRPAAATSCFSLETARPQGGASRPIGRQHRRPHLDDPAHAQRQGVRTAPQTAPTTNHTDTDDKEGLGGWRRQAPVGRHAHSEGRAVCSPPDPPRHHLRAPFCRPERLRGKQATRVSKIQGMSLR